MIRQSSKVSRQQEVERYLRDESQGLTTVELARRMGVSTRTVQRTLADHKEFARLNTILWHAEFGSFG